MTLAPSQWTCEDMISISNSEKYYTELGGSQELKQDRKVMGEFEFSCHWLLNGASVKSPSLCLPACFCRSDAHCLKLS